MAEEFKEPLFKDINVDDEPETTAIESLCMSCEKNVSTLHESSISFTVFYSIDLFKQHVLKFYI